MSKMPKLGNGQRFAALKSKLAVKGASNPAGLAVFIGRKKLGSKKFNALARKGKERLMLHQKVARGMKP